MRIEYAKRFQKKIKKVPAEIRLAFIQRAKIFEKGPFHTLLNNHALYGEYQGYRSINITGDWRAIFREYGNYALVSFETLGTHSQLYKK